MLWNHGYTSFTSVSASSLVQKYISSVCDAVGRTSDDLEKIDPPLLFDGNWPHRPSTLGAICVGPEMAVWMVCCLCLVCGRVHESEPGIVTWCALFWILSHCHEFHEQQNPHPARHPSAVLIRHARPRGQIPNPPPLSIACPGNRPSPRTQEVIMKSQSLDSIHVALGL